MSFLAQRSDVSEFRRRYSWMVFAVVVVAVIFSFRLAKLQLLDGARHREQARRNIVRRVTLATSRGVIRDAEGRVLAANRPSYNVYVVPELIQMEADWPRIAKLLALPEAESKQLAQKVIDRKKEYDAQGGDAANVVKRQLLLKSDVDRDVVAVLETHEPEFRHKDGLQKIEVSPNPVRFYPYGELGAHLVGYMREVDAEMLARLEDRDYRGGDRLGAVGVERRWESYLRGHRGWQKAVRRLPPSRDRDEVEAKYLDEPRRSEAIPGRDISLTVDIELMASVHRAMKGQLAGAVVVVDVRSGRLLAAYSKPSFDPNILSGTGGKEAVRQAFKRLYTDPLKPTLDKTISASYPPGSTYKPFTALAGLSDGLIDRRTRVDCRGGYKYGGKFFRCTGVHRGVDLHSSLVQSCNTYFYELGEALQNSPKSGIDRLARIGLDYGLGLKTGIGINPESRGRMPTRGWYTRRYKGAFRGGHTLLAAIGQGATTVTVLQLALAYAALANGGTLYQPQVVRSIETSDGTIVQELPPRVRKLVQTDEEHLRFVKNGLIGVVEEPNGTAHASRIEGVDVAGKTGTAQVSHVTPRGVDPLKIWYFNRDHAWFSGYAPAAAPEIAIVVLVEHGGGGGKNAAPVAMRVVRDWQKLKATRQASRGGKRKVRQGGTL